MTGLVCKTLAAAVAVLAAGTPAIAGPTRASATHHLRAVAAAEQRYAVTPYYVPDGQQRGAYKLYSVRVSGRAAARKLLGQSKNGALIPVASRGSKELVDVSAPGSGTSEVAVVNHRHVHVIANATQEDSAAGYLPDGDIVYFNGSPEEIVRCSPNGGHSHVLFHLPRRADAVTGVVSSDGKDVYFVGYDNGDGNNANIYRLTIATRQLKELAIKPPKPYRFSQVAVSPDGSQLAVSLRRSPRGGGVVQRIGLASAHGGRLHVIADKWSKGAPDADPHGLTQPFFSPDSREVLASYETPSNQAGLVMVTVATRKYKTLPGGAGLLSGPPMQ